MQEAEVRFATVATTPFYKTRVEDYPRDFEGSLMMNAFGTAMVLCSSVVFIPRGDFRIIASAYENDDGNRWMAIPVRRLLGVIHESKWNQLLELFKINSEDWNLDILGSRAQSKEASMGIGARLETQEVMLEAA